LLTSQRNIAKLDVRQEIRLGMTSPARHINPRGCRSVLRKPMTSLYPISSCLLKAACRKKQVHSAFL